jgi:hypothetical protein
VAGAPLGSRISRSPSISFTGPPGPMSVTKTLEPTASPRTLTCISRSRVATSIDTTGG